MAKIIVIAGGTGFIGTYLTQYYLSQGYQVKLIARTGENSIPWSDTIAIHQVLEGAELLINLAGKSVDCRYNAKNKQTILLSRTTTTTILGNAIKKCNNPPKLWINSSTATIYRHAEDRPMTEVSGEIGTGFSVEVAKAWEKSFFDFKLSTTRQVALRIAIVLGEDGGALKPLTTLVKVGLGGKQGNGKQKFSWLHIEDLKNIILFIQNNATIEGVLNCSAPNPTDNDTLMTLLREKLNWSFGIPSPKWLLEMGAVFIRTETELILKSRWVLPDKLIKLGFEFTYPKIDTCISNLIKK